MTGLRRGNGFWDPFNEACVISSVKSDAGCHDLDWSESSNPGTDWPSSYGATSIGSMSNIRWRSLTKKGLLDRKSCDLSAIR